MKKERFVLFATGCLLPLVIFLFWQWASMRFWLYHSQNRHLNPADYEARVLTPNEYEQLINPEVLGEVRIGNGSQVMIKTGDQDWEAKAKSRYKSVYNGKYYVQVITKGTAHFLVYWVRGTGIPAAIFSLGGLLFLMVYHVKGKTEK